MGKFQVKLSGTYTAGTSEATAAQSFSELFKIDLVQATNLLQRAPIVIRKDLDRDTAEKFKKALEKAGMVTFVETMPDAAQAAATPRSIAPLEPSPAVTDDQSVIHSDPNTNGFSYKVEGKPDYAFLTVQLSKDQSIKVEASAMASMDSNLEMKTKVKGGLGRLLTGESIFVNEFTASGGPAEIGIAPGSPGDIGHVYLQNDIIYLQNSAFVASDMGVNIETKWQGLVKGFFSGESLFLIRCSGVGDLWFNTYGAMIEIDVNGDYVVDTGNIVAFTEGLEYEITKVGGYKSLFFSGEGFVCRFSGQGKVWIQTRSTQAFAAWLYPFRPVKSNNSNGD